MFRTSLAHAASSTLFRTVFAVFAVLASVTWVAARASGGIQIATGNSHQNRKQEHRQPQVSLANHFRSPPCQCESHNNAENEYLASRISWIILVMAVTKLRGLK